MLKKKYLVLKSARYGRDMHARNFDTDLSNAAQAADLDCHVAAFVVVCARDEGWGTGDECTPREGSNANHE